MSIADPVRRLIQTIHALSPYAWADTLLRRHERNATTAAEAHRRRQQRLTLSERYIVYWLFAAIVLFLLAPWLPLWLPAWLDDILPLLLLLRILGLLNKELGVILFGICKITEGSQVSASGRVIVLALINYLTALFLFATLYMHCGHFMLMPTWLSGDPLSAALLHASHVHFSLSGLLEPADVATAWLGIAHLGFCFLFGTIVISLFVSLLNIRPQQA